MIAYGKDAACVDRGYRHRLTYLCNQVQAEHGYGGLSSVLPYDYDSYMTTEYQLAQQYSGLEVDTPGTH
ncbi:hypothetical protein D9M68_891710 [compost metagenome]